LLPLAYFLLLDLRSYNLRGKTMASKAKTMKAMAYIRTSSAANVGSDKDSDKRQRAAIEEFSDPGV
jgi:hypothetical protein